MNIFLTTVSKILNDQQKIALYVANFKFYDDQKSKQICLLFEPAKKY